MPEKTEAPTPRRLAKARTEGQVAQSAEVNTAVLLIVAFWLLGPMGRRLAHELGTFTRVCLGRLPDNDLTWTSLSSTGLSWARHLALILLPFVLCLLATSVGASLLQTGFLLSYKSLIPSLARFNPLARLSSLVFSKQSLIVLAKSAIKIAIVSLVAYSEIRDAYPLLLSSPWEGLAQGLQVWQETALKLGMRIGATFVALAMVDYMIQRHQWWQSMRMTRQELREERRQTEGDPFVRSRLRQRQQHLARSRMMAAVPESDVVVTNPIHLAVALKYEIHQMRAPIVTAKGARLLADRIRKVGRKHRVPIVQNRPLAHALYEHVEVGQEIPSTLYEAVASVLAFVYGLKAKSA